MSFKVGDKVRLSKIGKEIISNYNAYDTIGTIDSISTRDVPYPIHVTWNITNYTDVFAAKELIKNKDILKWIL